MTKALAAAERGVILHGKGTGSLSINYNLVFIHIL